MEKSILNEIARMRKMMGLSEGPVSVNDYQSGENSYEDGSTNFEDMFYKTLNGHEINSLEFEGVVYVDGRNRCIVSNGERITPSKEQLKDLWDEYVESEGLYLEKANESNNGEMGHNINFVGEDKGYSTESVGIVSDRGKLMAGYFQDGRLVSLGDMILFDVQGNLVKMGGGYPTGGFKNETSVEELEQDICKSYDDVLETLRKDAPVAVSLNEGTYEIIKTSVECNI